MKTLYKRFARYLACQKLSKIVARKKASYEHRRFLERREAALKGVARRKGVA